MSSIFLQPDPRRKRLVVQADASTGTTVHAEIAGTDVQGNGPAGTPLNLPFPEFIPWSPGNPHLYTLKGCVGDDAFDLPFGMREVAINEQRVCINQRPMVLKGTRWRSRLDESDVPERIAAFVAAGFNWIRCEPEDDLNPLLSTSGEQGIAVSVDMRRVTSVERATALIHRLANSTSIIAWECATDEVAEAVGALDPTRPVFVGSQVFRPYRNAPEPLSWVTATVLTPIARETETLLSRFGHQHSVNVISVHGFKPPVPGDPIVSGLADTGATDAHAAGSIRACVDAMRKNPRLAGYCFEDALDAGVVAERLTAFSEAQALVRPVISMSRSNLTPREEVDVSVSLLNEARLEGRAEVSLQVVGPTNQVLWKKKRGVKVPKHGKELWAGTIAASGSVGTHRFVVRLMDERAGRVGEGSVSFHVSPPVEPWRGAVDVLDPAGAWLEKIRPLAPQVEATAPIVLMPPLARSIRVWPDNPLGQALGRVREGAVGIVFDPPADWADLGATLSTPVDTAIDWLTTGDLAGSIAVARLHPVFEGLPAGGPLARPYRGLVSASVLCGESEDDIAPVATWNGTTASAHRVLVRRFGSGRLVFITIELLDRLGKDPVVDRLFVNLLRYSERRAIENQEIARVETRAVEWLRQERRALRVWRVIGPFANWDGSGHDTAHPPEEGFDAAATYAGWYRAATWETWHQRPDADDEVTLSRLLRPDMARLDPCPGTYYAYTDLTSEERVETRFTLRHAGSAKCWLNGRALELGVAPGADAPGADIVLKQGRNPVLVKVSVTEAPASFTLSVRDDAGLRWR
jgi:hypothetical protein